MYFLAVYLKKNKWHIITIIIKSEHLLEQNNFKGKSIDGRRRAPITLQVIKRIVHKKMDRYKETEKIQFIYGN